MPAITMKAVHTCMQMQCNDELVMNEVEPGVDDDDEDPDELEPVARSPKKDPPPTNAKKKEGDCDV